MDVRTGRVVSAELYASMSEEEQRQYVPVPRRLERTARNALRGRNGVLIDVNSDHPLAKWARKKTGREK